MVLYRTNIFLGKKLISIVSACEAGNFFLLDVSFWGFVLALIKAAFWPAYVVFEVLGGLGVR